MADYLLYATERYALAILQPLADALGAMGHGVHALLVGGAAGAALAGPVRAVDVAQAVKLRPRAVFSAANDVPPFVAGAKVQLFHGFNVEKRDDARGHFRVRGLFDLYCTQGPAATAPFRDLARTHGHIAWVETGAWHRFPSGLADYDGRLMAASEPGPNGVCVVTQVP